MTLPPAFHRLAWSNLAAQTAEQIGLAAVPMVAVLALGAQAAETGALAAAQTLPFLLLSLPAGVLADRLRRRRLMAGGELARAAALAAIPALAFLGLVSVPVLAVLGFLAATGTVVFSVAAPAVVPALVPREGLAAANGRLELARSVAFAAGPPLGGLLVGTIGASPAFGLAAALSVMAAALLVGVTEPETMRRTPRDPLTELREGAAFVWTHRLMRPTLLTSVVWNFAWFVLQSVYVLFAVQRIGMSAPMIGASLGCYGVGMVTGAMLARRLSRHVSFGALVAAGPAASVLAILLLTLTIAAPTPALAFAAFFVFGAGPILWTITSTTLRQAVTPPQMLGRVSAMIMMTGYGARPIGAAIGGAVGAWISLDAAILVAAAGFAVQAWIIAASPVPGLARLPQPMPAAALQEAA